jgi:hypothetical protein
VTTALCNVVTMAVVVMVVVVMVARQVHKFSQVM